MALGLSNSISKSGIVTPGVVTDSLVLKHNYSAREVHPVTDGAAYFDGNGDRINIGVIDTPSGAFSMGCWFKILTGQLEEFPTLMGRATWTGSHTHGIMLRFKSDSSASDTTLLTVSMGDSTSSTGNDFNTAPTRDVWNHVMITVDGEATGSKTLKCYLNGVLDDTKTSCRYQVDTDATTEFQIGKAENLNSGDSEFKGYICNAGMWDTDLTQAQIQSIMWKDYARLSSSEKTNLVSWWNLDTAYDIDDTTEGTETTKYVFDDHHGGGNTLGSDVMTGGDMSSDSGWAQLASGWSVSDGKLRRDSTDSFNSAIRATSGLTEGSLYKVTVDVSTTNGNPLIIYLGEAHSGSLTDNIRGRTQVDGTVVFYLVAGANDNIYFYSGSGGTRWSGTIDNVVIQEVNGNHGVLG